jgi:hypothetical protein
MATCHPDIKHFAHGYCSACYQRARKDGSLDGIKHGKIPYIPKLRTTVCAKCGVEHETDRAGTWCKPCAAASNKRYQRDNAAKVALKGHSQHLRKKYGMDGETYCLLLADQGGLCAICKQTETPITYNGVEGYVRRLSVDHDHDTGVVRGILCQGCNAGIGMLGEDPDRLLAAIDYLKAWGK